MQLVEKIKFPLRHLVPGNLMRLRKSLKSQLDVLHRGQSPAKDTEVRFVTKTSQSELVRPDNLSLH